MIINENGILYRRLQVTVIMTSIFQYNMTYIIVFKNMLFIFKRFEVKL